MAWDWENNPPSIAELEQALFTPPPIETIPRYEGVLLDITMETARENEPASLWAQRQADGLALDRRRRRMAATREKKNG
ncbi:MAG: hypothetical protein ABIG63_11485 [Chloroflexota bacterium]